PPHSAAHAALRANPIGVVAARLARRIALRRDAPRPYDMARIGQAGLDAAARRGDARVCQILDFVVRLVRGEIQYEREGRALVQTGVDPRLPPPVVDTAHVPLDGAGNAVAAEYRDRAQQLFVLPPVIRELA